jgi:hypothetical protein
MEPPSTVAAMSKKRKEMEDINFDAQQKCCCRCWKMTATLDGLRALTSGAGYEHYNRQQLLAEAKRGCPLCVIIFEYCGSGWRKEKHANLRFFAESIDEHIILPQDRDNTGTHPFENNLLYAITAKWGKSPRFVRLCAFTGKGFCFTNERGVEVLIGEADDPAARFLKEREIPRNLSDDSVYLQAQGWLDECHERHHKCPKRDVPLLPKRILDLGTSDDDTIAKLHISSSGERGEYAALSYCWGGPQKVLTTRAVLDTNIQGLPINSLPKQCQTPLQYVESLGCDISGSTLFA